MLPMVGPLLYGCLFDGLEAQPDGMRASETRSAHHVR
jgi:hypothetical protein